MERIGKYEADVLCYLKNSNNRNQRIMAEEIGTSLGSVNKALKSLQNKAYIDVNFDLTPDANKILKESAPQNAVILAAGYGMRMVPINMEKPKGLLSVRGEILIERLIRQLKSAGVKKIYIIVGYMKEAFEYLIDEFDVELIVNREYGAKNNLHSLVLANNLLGNTYVVPCDIWCRKNPFSTCELYSWYMVSDEESNASNVRLNRKNELVCVDSDLSGNRMIGISYIMKDDADRISAKLLKYDSNSRYDNAFWEETLFCAGKMDITGKIVSDRDFIEIDTYEQLRDIDSESDNLRTEAMDIICKALSVRYMDITDIEVLKKGMTNRSFLFSAKGKRFIMRIPGEGTEQLINRKNEAAVYAQINALGICDDIAYINPDNGYKITEYFEGARVCDADNEQDLHKCMDKLRAFHRMKLKVDHEFDIFGQIEFYEQLRGQTESIYKDYADTKKNIMSLKAYLDKNISEKCLTHIDAVPDNFLFTNIDGKEEIKIIDWEYAGMQDPHVDVAMFCIYALYKKEEVDRLIDIYFEGKVTNKIKKKIYCYIAVCGFLWSNWCEYKRQLGIEFGEYSLRQYRYAKEYYRLAQEIEENE